MTNSARKWLSARELARLQAGEVPGMTVLDIRVVLEGQAEQVMRGIAKPLHWWELEDKK